MKELRIRKEMGKNRNKKVIQRLLSVILCFLLVTTMIPVSAFASVGEEFDDSGSGLRFKVLTEEGTAHTGTVAVVFNNYTGTVYNIPSTVDYNGITYTVTEVGEKAFYVLKKLKEITIPATVTNIGKSAFDCCYALTKVTIEESSQLKTIGNRAFSGIGIEEITIPATVTSIDTWVFSNCKALKKITIEENSQLETIGDKTFWEANLKEIKIPAKVTRIGSFAFYGCKELPR